MVVSPGGAVMVTGMWMLVRPLRLVFFRLSASSGFSITGNNSEGDCRGLVAEPSASVSECLSLDQVQQTQTHIHTHAHVERVDTSVLKTFNCLLVLLW